MDRQVLTHCIVSKAATKGTKNISSFKREWRDEKTRQLFKDANAANTPQGVDAWLVDYQSLAKVRDVNSSLPKSTEKQSFDTMDEARTAIDKAAKPGRKIEITASTDSVLFPITAEVARMQFKIVRDDTSSGYEIDSVSGGSLAKEIIESITNTGMLKNMDKILVRFPTEWSFHTLIYQTGRA